MERSKQAAFRPLIGARIEEIEHSLERSSGDTEAISPDVAIGRLSRLDSMQMQQMTLGMRQRQREELNQLKQALKRIANGRYGSCDLCRNDIAIERLEFQLDATVCMDCLKRLRK